MQQPNMQSLMDILTEGQREYHDSLNIGDMVTDQKTGEQLMVVSFDKQSGNVEVEDTNNRTIQYIMPSAGVHPGHRDASNLVYASSISEDNNDMEAQSEQVAAISQLIADRTEDENSPSKLSTEAFVGLINKMGLPMTQQTLMDLVEKGQLESIIKDVNQDEVQFKGQQDVDPTAMSVDKAKDVVATMAKRAAKKGIMK